MSRPCGDCGCNLGVAKLDARLCWADNIWSCRLVRFLLNLSDTTITMNRTERTHATSVPSTSMLVLGLLMRGLLTAPAVALSRWMILLNLLVHYHLASSGNSIRGVLLWDGLAVGIGVPNRMIIQKHGWSQLETTQHQYNRQPTITTVTPTNCKALRLCSHVFSLCVVEVGTNKQQRNCQKLEEIYFLISDCRSYGRSSGRVLALCALTSDFENEQALR